MKLSLVTSSVLILTFISVKYVQIEKCATYGTHNNLDSISDLQNVKKLSNDTPNKHKITFLLSDSTYKAGFMYWYAPHLLDIRWDLVVTGSVIDIVLDTSGRRLAYDSDFITGKLKIKEILYSDLPSVEYERTFKYLSSAGFNGMNIGDRLIVFLIKYEGDYAVPSYEGTNCRIGYKIDSWQDPVLKAVKKFLELNQDIFKLVENNELLKVWETYDLEGVRRIKELVKILKDDGI